MNNNTNTGRIIDNGKLEHNPNGRLFASFTNIPNSYGSKNVINRKKRPTFERIPINKVTRKVYGDNAIFVKNEILSNIPTSNTSNYKTLIHCPPRMNKIKKFETGNDITSLGPTWYHTHPNWVYPTKSTGIAGGVYYLRVPTNFMNHPENYGAELSSLLAIQEKGSNQCYPCVVFRNKVKGVVVHCGTEKHSGYTIPTFNIRLKQNKSKKSPVSKKRKLK